MKPERFRLPQGRDSTLAGRLIDRKKPLRFRLDGRQYDAFEGDTILSAVMAGGTDTFGDFRGAPLALTTRFHPPVIRAEHRADRSEALAMDRTPAVEGMELVTLGKSHAATRTWRTPFDNLWRRLAKQRVPSLGLDAESISPFPGPWVEREADAVRDADIVVVGGGVAGMRAALEAAEGGASVLIVERQAELGGRAEFFGAQEGETRPGELVPEMIEEIEAAPRIEVLRRTEALSYSAGWLRAHRIGTEGGLPQTEIVNIKGTGLVLTTGVRERLPLFPGNRLPGTMSALAAFDLAVNYGVWRGKSAIYAINSSPAAQIALRAAELGIETVRLADSRLQPQSRFFDFAKAYGISLSSGVFVRRAEPAGDSERLAVTLGLMLDQSGTELETLEADRLIHCGGWQADLTLWHMVGGATRWNPEPGQFQPVGEVENVALAGSCAGAETLTASIESGRRAARTLMGKPHRVTGRSTAPGGLESPDGPVTVSRPGPDDAHCFFDTGHSFAVLPAARRKGWISRLFPDPPDTGMVGIEPRALSLNDIAAKVLLGDLAPSAAGIIARERCVVSAELGKPVANPGQADGADPDPRVVPAYLIRRFGEKEAIVRTTTADGRTPETGCLIFANSMESDPRKAVGVVLGPSPETEGESLVYMDTRHAGPDARLVVRDGTQTVELFYEARA